MGDGDSRATLRDPIESKLDDLFALRINRAGGFVKYDDLWFLYYTPCNSEALFLTSRKFYSAVTNFRIVALFIIWSVHR
jgi:hypothetical protein